MNFDDIIAFLESKHIAYSIHEHEAVYTMEAVRELVDLPLELSVKSLVFRIKGTDSTVLAALPGMSKIDYRLLADALSVRRRDIRPMESEDVLNDLGDVPGAVGPFQGNDVTIVVDKQLAVMEKVHCGSGRPDRTIEISGADLAGLAKTIVPLTVEDS